MARWDLVDPLARTLSGVVYGLTGTEQSRARKICTALNDEAIRYCISHKEAADMLGRESADLTEPPVEESSSSASSEGLPLDLHPVRQLLNEIFQGKRDRLELKPELRQLAARFFDDSAARIEMCSRFVEVTWIKGPSGPVDGLPSWYPSRFSPTRAQRFAEDIWYYRQPLRASGAQPDLVAVGFTHLDDILKQANLKLPKLESTLEVTPG